MDRRRKLFLFGGRLTVVVVLVVLVVGPFLYVGLNEEPQNESDVIMEIINSHPREEIRKGLPPLIQQGMVQVRFDPNIPLWVPMKVNIGELKDGTRIVFLFHGPGLLGFTLEQQWVILVHEHQHIRDLLEPTKIPQNVTDVYEDEVRAYIAECIFAHEIQVNTDHPSQIFQACLVFQKVHILGFRLWLAEYLARNTEGFMNYRELFLRQAESGP